MADVNVAACRNCGGPTISKETDDDDFNTGADTSDARAAPTPASEWRGRRFRCSRLNGNVLLSLNQDSFQSASVSGSKVAPTRCAVLSRWVGSTYNLAAARRLRPDEISVMSACRD
jgi:hypothetical protein